MSASIKQVVTVQSGGLVEVRSPELREGDQAEVTIVITHAASHSNDGQSVAGWRRFAGAFDSGDARAGDNERIEADLIREYGGQRKSEP